MSEPVPPDVRALLILHLTPGLGPVRTAALLERFGSASEVLRAAVADIAEVPQIGPRLAERIAHAPDEVDVDGELARVERAGVCLVPLGTPAYPTSLAAI